MTLLIDKHKEHLADKCYFPQQTGERKLRESQVNLEDSCYKVDDGGVLLLQLHIVGQKCIPEIFWRGIKLLPFCFTQNYSQ